VKKGAGKHLGVVAPSTDDDKTNLQSVVEALAALKKVHASQEVGLVLLCDVIGRAAAGTIRSVPEVLQEVEARDGFVQVSAAGSGQRLLRKPPVQKAVLQLGQLGVVDAKPGSGASRGQSCETRCLVNVESQFCA